MNSQPVLDALVTELAKLRKGRGIDADPIRIGDSLSAFCGVTGTDGPAELRRKVRARLTEAAKSLPEDLRLAVSAAYALTPDARHPFYQERVRWAAGQLGRDERTLRRRVDDGTRQLAGILAAQANQSPATEADADGWHTASLSTMLNMTLATPEAFEFRRIVADRDQLAELDLAVTMTAPPPGAIAPATGLTMDVLYGGALVRRTMESAHRYGLALALPHPLSRGTEHDFALRFRVPDGQTMNPHFVVVPRQPCDRLEVRVKFDEKKLPAGVWKLTKVFQNELDDPVHRVHPVALDSAAELRVEFSAPLPGFAYGVQWDPDTDGERSH